MNLRLRHFAQSARHFPVLRRIKPLWDILRGPYRRFLQYTSGNTGLEVTIAGMPVKLDPAFAHIAWECVEREAYLAFCKSIGPGSIVFDVGAHLGTYAILGAKCSAPDGIIVAFEPHDVTRGFLLRHLEWNDCASRVLVRSCCCGARNETRQFYFLPGQPEGRNSLIKTGGFHVCDIEVTTVDDEVVRLGRVPTALKIDVEGTEYDVLRGAEQTLRNHRPVVFLSLHPEQLRIRGESCEEVISWLADMKYRVDAIGADHELHVCAKPV